MLEASHVLGLKNDRITLAAGKRMVDHSLKMAGITRLAGFTMKDIILKTS
jgi:mannobiose 2-epimerase